MTAHWSVPLIGLPYRSHGRDRSGVDCWGLVCLVAREAAGLHFPTYDGEYVSSDERREIAAVVAREADSALWQRVEPGSEREFDVAWFRRGATDAHAGIIVRKGLMLHIEEEAASARIADYRLSPWQRRLTAIYRFKPNS